MATIQITPVPDKSLSRPMSTGSADETRVHFLMHDESEKLKVPMLLVMSYA